LETPRTGAAPEAKARRPWRLRSSPRAPDVFRTVGAGGGHRAGWAEQVGQKREQLKEVIVGTSWEYTGIELRLTE